jgi:CrcB protein
VTAIALGPVSLLLATLGTVLGALLRFEISRRLVARIGDAFPWATLSINLSGGFAAGLLLGLAPDPGWMAFGLLGVLGGYTTVSSFSLECLLLLQRGHRFWAIAYVILSSLGVPLAAMLGWMLGGGP